MRRPSRAAGNQGRLSGGGRILAAIVNSRIFSTGEIGKYHEALDTANDAGTGPEAGYSGRPVRGGAAASAAKRPALGKGEWVGCGGVVGRRSCGVGSGGVDHRAVCGGAG